MKLPYDVNQATAGPEPKADHAANGFQIAVGQVAALPQLGEDLEFALGFQIDSDVDMHVAERRELSYPDTALDFGQRRGLQWARFQLSGLGCGGLGLVAVFQRHGLELAATVAIHGHALAREGERQAIDLFHVLRRCVLREIDRLGDRGIAMFLEGGLHAHVPLGCYVVCTDKDPSDVIGDVG